jgi:hypothetical protein
VETLNEAQEKGRLPAELQFSRRDEGAGIEALKRLGLKIKVIKNPEELVGAAVSANSARDASSAGQLHTYLS